MNRKTFIKRLLQVSAIGALPVLYSPADRAFLGRVCPEKTANKESAGSFDRKNTNANIGYARRKPVRLEFSD